MNKKVTLKRRDKLLKKLQKEVPSIDWEFQRLETKGIYHNIDKEGWENEEMYRILYVFKCKKDFGDDGDTFTKVSGEIQFEHRNDVELDIQCFFNDEVSYINKQRKLVPNYDSDSEKEQWDKVREFFKTYMIPISKRIETELHTPRIDSLYYNLHKCYQYEFNEILLRTLFDDEDNRKHYKTIFNDFENDYNKLMKENNKSNQIGYFGTPMEMIKSFLEEKGMCEMEYYLEQQMEWIKEDEQIEE